LTPSNEPKQCCAEINQLLTLFRIAEPRPAPECDRPLDLTEVYRTVIKADFEVNATGKGYVKSGNFADNLPLHYEISPE